MAAVAAAVAAAGREAEGRVAGARADAEAAAAAAGLTTHAPGAVIAHLQSTSAGHMLTHAHARSPF